MKGSLESFEVAPPGRQIEDRGAEEKVGFRCSALLTNISVNYVKCCVYNVLYSRRHNKRLTNADLSLQRVFKMQENPSCSLHPRVVVVHVPNGRPKGGV